MTYHETLWSAVQAATEAVPARHALAIATREEARPMAYETAQTLRLPLVADAGVTRDRRSVLVVYLYRMPSGRYEVSAYAA